MNDSFAFALYESDLIIRAEPRDSEIGTATAEQKRSTKHSDVATILPKNSNFSENTWVFFLGIFRECY